LEHTTGLGISRFFLSLRTSALFLFFCALSEGVIPISIPAVLIRVIVADYRALSFFSFEQERNLA